MDTFDFVEFEGSRSDVGLLGADEGDVSYGSDGRWGDG